MKITRKENDPKTHMTLVQYCYEEQYLDIFLRVYQWESKNGEIRYGWEISKEYPKSELRRTWSHSDEDTFQAAYAIIWEKLFSELEHRELLGEIFEWTHGLDNESLFGGF